MNTALTLPLRWQSGLTYVESLLGVVILSLCLVPAMQGITNALSPVAMLPEMARDIACLRGDMERTMSEPYASLIGNAVSAHTNGSFTKPAYSFEPTPACPHQRRIYILRYNPELADPFTATGDDMVYVRAEQVNTMPLATLAIMPP